MCNLVISQSYVNNSCRDFLNSWGFHGVVSGILYSVGVGWKGLFFSECLCFFCFFFFSHPFFLDFWLDEQVYHDDVEEVLEESNEEGSEGFIGGCKRAYGSGMDCTMSVYWYWSG